MAPTLATPFSTRLRVRATDVDRWREASPGRLFAFFEQCRWEAFLATGGAYDEVDLSVPHFVVRAQRVDHLAPAVAGDVLLVSLNVEKVGRTSVVFGHEVRREADGEPVARGRLTAVYVDARKGPVPIGEDLRQQVAPSTASVRGAPPWTPPPADTWSVDLPMRVSDLDLLAHVNQARYADLVGDAIARAGAGSGRLSGVAIDYDRELLGTMVVRFTGWPVADGVVRVVGRVGDQVHFRATAWLGGGSAVGMG